MIAAKSITIPKLMELCPVSPPAPPPAPCGPGVFPPAPVCTHNPCVCSPKCRLAPICRFIAVFRPARRTRLWRSITRPSAYRRVIHGPTHSLSHCIFCAPPTPTPAAAPPPHSETAPAVRSISSRVYVHARTHPCTAPVAPLSPPSLSPALLCHLPATHAHAQPLFKFALQLRCPFVHLPTTNPPMFLPT